MTTLDAEGFELVRRLRSVSKTIAQWSEIKREIRDQLLKVIGNEDGADWQGERVVTVIRSHPRRFDAGHFGVDHPALYEAYRVQSDEEVRLTLAKTFPGEGVADA